MTNLLFEVLRATYPDNLMNHFLNDTGLVKQRFDSHEDLIAAHLACLAEACHREDPHQAVDIFAGTLTTIIDELSAVQAALAKVEEIAWSEHTRTIYETLCAMASIFFPHATSASLHLKHMDAADEGLELDAIDFYANDSEKLSLVLLSSTERDAVLKRCRDVGHETPSHVNTFVAVQEAFTAWFIKFRKPLEQGGFEPGPYSLSLYLPTASSEDIGVDDGDLELSQRSDLQEGD
jgi:hypothetical protein